MSGIQTGASTSERLADVVERLARIERLAEGIADRQKADGDVLRMTASRQDQLIKLLTPEERDGPTLDEMMGSMIGHLTELIGYARQHAKAQSQMEQNLPGDVVRAIKAAGLLLAAATAGAGANGHGGGHRP